MKYKKGILLIVIAMIILGYFVRQGYYYLGYINVMNGDVNHVEPVYINTEGKIYESNQSFEEITIDTKTVTNENLECVKNDSEDYISQQVINYSCKKDDILILYNSGKDLKFNYEEGEVIVFGDEVPFYKYEVKGKDVENYLNKNNIERGTELLLHATKTDYIKVNFFSRIKNIKEATAYNLIKSISVPIADKVFIITKNEKEFRIYNREGMYIIESELNERGFFIALDKILEITIEDVVNLIDSIESIE